VHEDGIILPVTTIEIPSGETQFLIRRLQAITIAWMLLEVILSLWSAWRASSPALAAFGGDSAVELWSAVIVMWRFRSKASEHEERLAARLAGILLVVLAVFVVSASAISLLGHHAPQPSYLGMAVLVAALVIMPWLASQKRRLSAVTGSAALRADAAQSSLCAYLSFIALIGLAVHALWHIEWADPVAALAVTPLILFEAREALQGRACKCN
jgi:divalent metal cation (Fe/Co/Zn/Cd) transporter